MQLQAVMAGGKRFTPTAPQSYNLDLTTLEDYLQSSYGDPSDDPDGGESSTVQKGFSFNYVNAASDWVGFSTSKIDAVINGNFTGPFLKINAYKQADAGRINVQIYKLVKQVDQFEKPQKMVSKLIYTKDVDLYSASPSIETVIDYEFVDFSDYRFVIRTLPQRNKSSSGTFVKIHSFEYLKANRISFGQREYDPRIIV